MRRFEALLKSIKHFSVLIVVFLWVSSFVLTPVYAKINVDVDFSLCQEGGRTDDWLVSIDKDSTFGVTGGVFFNLPEHEDANVRLTTSKGIAWTQGYGRASWKWFCKAYYNVAFYDQNWDRVWVEWGAIPNGKSRDFFVGSNVRHIQVWSYWDYNPSGRYITGILVPPCVGWDGEVK